MSPQSNHLTTQEAAAELRVSTKTLQRWRLARKITYVRLGGKFLYPRIAIESFIAKRTLVAA